MRYKFLVSPGGSLQVVTTSFWQLVEDSDKLAGSGLIITGLRTVKGGVEETYAINKTFSSKEALVLWLNSTFVQITGLSDFRLDQGYIDYDNQESFNTIEIMAVYGNYTLVFKVGNPEGAGRQALTLDTDLYDVVVVDNGDTFTHSALANKLTGVKVGVTNVEPVAGEAGYTHTPDTNTPENSAITFGQSLSDTYVYVSYTQVPEAV